MLRLLRCRSSLGVPALCFSLLVASPALAQSFADDFAIDSTGSYTLSLINPAEGTSTFVYDAPGQRAQILTGNDFGLRVAHGVPSRTSGRLSVDLLPTKKFPSGGQIFVRLLQDAQNYYAIYNSDGYGPGTLRKIVGGQVVATASFTAGYVQNVAYPVRFDFTPGLSLVSAFGQTLAIAGNSTPLAITSVEIETYQQSAYVDSISYGDSVNLAPLADAGPDQAVADGELVQLDGSASSDADGSIATYSWLQLSGPAVVLSNASSASPTFVAPDLGSGSVALVFELTVTDDAGTPASDAVQIEAWSSEALSFSDDFSSNTTGDYTLTLILPAEGTATFVYDGAGQRAQILTGNDFGLRVAHDLPPRTSGRLRVDLLPTKKYPSGGQIFVRLLQDAQNYYEIYNSDGYGPGTLRKIVGGQVVATASFTAGYVQNAAYHVLFDFAPNLSELTAFGQTLALAGNSTPLVIRSLEIQAYQQSLYLDDVSYGEALNLAPFADAGPDATAPGGELVQLDGSGSSDFDGQIASYFWQQLSGPAVVLSSTSSASPTFVAPDPSSGSVPLLFRLTVTDDGGAPASDDVLIEAWSSSALLVSDDFSSDSIGSYTLSLVNPQEGTGTLVYDGAGQRAQILTGNDFGLRVARTLPPRSSGHFTLSLLPTKKYPSGGQIFVRLLQDAQNYYEIYNSDGYGPGSLTKVVGGQIVDVASFANGYLQNTTYPIVFDFSADLTTLEAFGQFLALQKVTPPLLITQLEIEAYQQDVYFDDLSLSDFVELPPFVRLNAPADNLFQSSTTLRAEALGFRFQPGWSVAFAVDIATPDERLIVDAAAPFVVNFANVSKGTHTVDAYVVDASGAQVFGAELHDQVSGVDIGDYYFGFGDSITVGQGDNIGGDDVSADGRDSGGGYEPVLNDLLTAELDYAHTVKNEGVGGRTSAWGASKIGGILNKHPNAVFVLVLFGTNDSKNEIALAPSTYKGNMQSIVSTILARGKTPILAKIPMAYGNCGRCSPYPNPQNAAQNVRIRAYNQAIDELVVENMLPVAGPDLYTHFAQHPEQLADRLHPNGIGYQAIAELWLDALLAP